MTTTRDQFRQRAAEYDRSGADRLTRRDLAYLAGVSEKTVRNWLAGDPFRSSATRGPRGVELYPPGPAIEWVRQRLFPEDLNERRRPGPHLAVDASPMPYAPGDRWRFTDMAKVRAVTANAISKLAATYRAHSTHPFPGRGGDDAFDAAEVSHWFHWYDSSRPGYGAPRPVATRGAAQGGRQAVITRRVAGAADLGQDLTTKMLCDELGLSPETAARYLAVAAKEVMPGRGLISRNQMADRLPASMTPSQRRERIKTLLKRQSAPTAAITIAGTAYFKDADVSHVLPPQA